MPSLVVRKNVRHDVALRAAVSITGYCTDIVRLSPAANAPTGWLDLDCVDLSLGGVGFASPVFFPRQTKLKVKLFSPSESNKVILECVCVVRRVIMTDGRPAYHLGTSFDDMSEEMRVKAEQLLAMVIEQ